jgi:hypothetical protein
MEPFIVSSPRLTDLYDDEDLAEIGVLEELIPEHDNAEVDERDHDASVLEALADQLADVDDTAALEVSRLFALADTEISVQYRIRPSADGSGLLEHLQFVPDTRTRRQGMTTREHALRALALREVTQYLSRLSLDELLTKRRD